MNTVSTAKAQIQVLPHRCCELLLFTFHFLHSSSTEEKVWGVVFFYNKLFCCCTCQEMKKLSALSQSLSCPAVNACTHQGSGQGWGASTQAWPPLLSSQFPISRARCWGQRYQIKAWCYVKHKHDGLTAALLRVRGNVCSQQCVSISERSAPVYKISREIIVL